MSAGWPGLERHLRARVASGGVVTRQGTHVQIEMPGGSISWTRTEDFNRAVGAEVVPSSAIAVLPAAPFDRPIARMASAGLADFLDAALSGQRSA